MSRGLDWGVAAGGALLAALLAAWLAASGWVEPALLRFWATTGMAWQVPGFALDQLGLLYPHVPLLAALPLAAFGQPVAAIGLAVIAAGAIGLTTALWYGQLRHYGWPAHWALLLTGLGLAHPFSLWIVSRGGADSVALLAASLLVVVLARLTRGIEPRHVVIFALVLGFGLLLDPRWALYALIVIPFLPLLVGRAWLDEAAPGLLIVAVVPILGALLFLASAGWIFGGRPLAFLLEGGAWTTVPDGTPGSSPATAWRQMLWLFVATLTGAPALVLACWRCRGRRLALVILASCLPTAGLAVGFGLGAGWKGEDFLHVAIAASVPVLGLLRRWTRPTVVLGLVLFGQLGGWLVLTPLAGERITFWQAALVHAPVAEPLARERALAAFLAGGPATLIDDRLGFPAVVALGAGAPLVLPPSPAFTSQLLQPLPTIAQIAVPKPAHAGGDRIVQRHPDLWAAGLAGYRLVYDDAFWRVWRRSAPGDPGAELRRCHPEPARAKVGLGDDERASRLRAIACQR
jgi:hypothetical protein